MKPERRYANLKRTTQSDFGLTFWPRGGSFSWKCDSSAEVTAIELHYGKETMSLTLARHEQQQQGTEEMPDWLADALLHKRHITLVVATTTGELCGCVESATCRPCIYPDPPPMPPQE